MVFKDLEMLVEAYKIVNENRKADQKPLAEAKKKKLKPDYLDVNKDGNRKESMKNALKDKKNMPMDEQISSFRALYGKIMTEKKDTTVSFSKEPINPHLEADRKKLEKLRAKRKKESASKKK